MSGMERVITLEPMLQAGDRMLDPLVPTGREEITALLTTPDTRLAVYGVGWGLRLLEVVESLLPEQQAAVLATRGGLGSAAHLAFDEEHAARILNMVEGFTAEQQANVLAGPMAVARLAIKGGPEAAGRVLSMIEGFTAEQQTNVLAGREAVWALVVKGHGAQTVDLIKRLAPEQRVAVLAAPEAVRGLIYGGQARQTMDMVEALTPRQRRTVRRTPGASTVLDDAAALFQRLSSRIVVLMSETETDYEPVDRVNPLSLAGKRQVKNIADQLISDMGFYADVILTSSEAEMVQAGKLIAEAYGKAGKEVTLEQASGLDIKRYEHGFDDRVARCLTALDSRADGAPVKNIIVVAGWPSIWSAALDLGHQHINVGRGQAVVVASGEPSWGGVASGEENRVVRHIQFQPKGGRWGTLPSLW